MNKNPKRETLDSILFSCFGSDDFVKQWWDSPNIAFSGYSPTEMLDIKPEVVVQYILNQVNGVYH